MFNPFLLRNRNNWYLWHGSWWMIQACFGGWFSLGIHIETRRLIRSADNLPFGPYVDFHLGCFIVSLGRNPVYSGELERSISVSRGGRA